MEVIYNDSLTYRVNRPNRTLLFSGALLLVLAGSLIGAVLTKSPWLWMDEVLSYLLLSDPSLPHMNTAVVSGMDANPPLFVNVYWFIGHFISLNSQFLRIVSVLFFATTIGAFFIYINRLIGTTIQNFILVISIVGLTYLNFALATQIRAYALFLFISCGYFIILHQLITAPGRPKWLMSYVVVGTGLLLTHNFGLFYAAASGAFFVLLWFWSKQRVYLFVIAVHVLVLLIWLVIWYPSFAIQAEAGKPHSWIPIPGFLSFFTITGELVPTLSSKLERSRYFAWLPILRFGLVAGLFIYVSFTKLKTGFQSFIGDRAFQFYLLAGFIYFATIGLSLTVTLVHTSVFISRYLWPGHLLLIYQLVYAYYYFGGKPVRRPLFIKLLPVYGLILAAFIIYQSRKLPVFSGDILPDLAPLNKSYPIFIETADYFLPLWFHKLTPNVHYLLDWQTASAKGNYLNATVEHKILKSVRENYDVAEVVPKRNFTKAQFPHFYVVDESSQYQIEHFIKSGQVYVVRQIPVAIEGHQILECAFR